MELLKSVINVSHAKLRILQHSSFDRIARRSQGTKHGGGELNEWPNID